MCVYKCTVHASHVLSHAGHMQVTCTPRVCVSHACHTYVTCSTYKWAMFVGLFTCGCTHPSFTEPQLISLRVLKNGEHDPMKAVTVKVLLGRQGPKASLLGCHSLWMCVPYDRCEIQFNNFQAWCLQVFITTYVRMWRTCVVLQLTKNAAFAYLSAPQCNPV